jgi:hypothetical protein
MAQIKQAHSLVNDQKEDIDHSFDCYRAIKEAKADIRDNLQVVNSLSNSMNNLCTNLDRLDNLMETIIFCKDKENGK